jgi:hypothetical protein
MRMFEERGWKRILCTTFITLQYIQVYSKVSSVSSKNVEYLNGKMRPVETIPGIGEERIKENGGGVNSTMIYLIYCKNFCTTPVQHPVQQ